MNSSLLSTVHHMEIDDINDKEYLHNTGGVWRALRYAEPPQEALRAQEGQAQRHHVCRPPGLGQDDFVHPDSFLPRFGRAISIDTTSIYIHT